MTVPRFFKARSFDSASSSRTIYADPREQTHATGAGWANVASRTLLTGEQRTSNYEVRQVVVEFDAHTSGAAGAEKVRVTLNGAAMPDESVVSVSPTFAHHELIVPISDTGLGNAIAIQDKGAGGATLTIKNIQFNALIAMVTI